MSEDNKNQVVETGSWRSSIQTGGGVGAIIPQDFEAVWRLSNVIGLSRMCPKDFDTIEKVAVAIMHGMEVGLTPMAAMQSIAVINGRPSLWGDAVLGLVRSSGLMESFKEEIIGDGDNMKAVCTVKRKDDTETIVSEFSVSDAKKANLWGKSGPWSQYPKRMLKMRARGFALRDGFPDVLRGLHVAEEQSDIARSISVSEEAPPPPDPAIIEEKAEPKENKKEETVKQEPEEEKFGAYESPTDFLNALEDGLSLTNNAEDLEEVWNDFDPMAELQSAPDFIDTAEKIKDRHLKRIADASEEPPLFRNEG